jgi:RimJ/RimL family protein N-acetyltransferase
VQRFQKLPARVQSAAGRNLAFRANNQPIPNATTSSYVIAHVNEKPATTFAIAMSSEAIGCIGLQIGRDIHCKTAELGYWLGEPFWGRGIMSEAVAELTRCAFGIFDLERIYAEPFAGNRASARVLEKAGFVCEGRLRASIFKDGKRLDSFLYARVRDAAWRPA